MHIDVAAAGGATALEATPVRRPSRVIMGPPVHQQATRRGRSRRHHTCHIRHRRALSEAALDRLEVEATGCFELEWVVGRRLVALLSGHDQGIGARAKRAHEDLHAQDREDELKGEHDPDDVADGGHRLEERDDDELHPGVTGEKAQRAQHTQDPQHLELREHWEEFGQEH